MSYLKDDLSRLVRYAQGLGLRVSFKEHTPGDSTGAEWLTDGKDQEIVLYTWSGVSKVRLILNLLHELAHHVSFRHDRSKVSKTLLKALDMEDERDPKGAPIPKRYRKLIYESEARDALYREAIAIETHLKLPMWKIKADKDLDIWLYKCYYETGDTPKTKEISCKQTELRTKYREG